VVRAYNGVARLRERLGSVAPGRAFAEEELLEAARKATGLSDFGEGPWREGLRVLLDAYDHEARLSPFGRMMVRQEVIGILKSRLSVEAAWSRDAEALARQPVRRPLFILGLPRTGTTALHFLLAQDPGNQVLEYWLAASPGPRPPRETWERDPRYREARRGLRFLYYLDPSLKSIHWMTADGPDECRHLLQESFADDTFDSNATIPSYTKWFHAQDPRPAYRRHRDVLRLIGSPTPERRWVLKYPAHLRNLDVLFETYPDACVVQTYRDPSRVLPSLCSLVSGWRGLYEGGVDRRAIGARQVEMWAGIMERGIAARQRLPEDRFFDLPFREVVEDPVAAAGRIQAHFGLDLSAEAERRMRAWHAQNPPGRHGEHRYRAEDFGLREAEVAERFAPYLARFDVPREARG
jgi:hypothetical protein